MPKKPTKDELCVMIATMIIKLQDIDSKIDSLIEDNEDLPDEIAFENKFGDNIPFPVETLFQMRKYLGEFPMFLGIT